MTEDRTRDDGILMFQTVDQLKDIIHRIEPQTMHASIELDMYRPARDAFFSGRLDQRIEQAERVDLRLQIVVEHGLKGGHLRVHDHDIARNACLTERDALIGHSHSEVIDPLILQRLGYLHSTGSIAISLDHADHLRLGLQERAVIVQVIYHRIQIHLKDGLVYLLFQLFCNLIETKGACPLQQDQFITQTGKGIAGEEMGHVHEELLVGHLDLVGLRREFRTDTYKLLDATLHDQFAHLGIECLGRSARLEDIAENQRLLGSLTTVHEVESNVERVDVTIIRVVDQQATTLAFLHFQSHRYRLQTRHAFGQL